MTTEIVDNESESRFEAHVDGELAGILGYSRDAGPASIDFQHTIVMPSHRGQGIAGQLAEHAFADARSAGLKVIPSCPFIQGWLPEHPEVADLIA